MSGPQRTALRSAPPGGTMESVGALSPPTPAPRARRPWPRAWTYPLLGTLLSLASPLGFLVLRSLVTRRPLSVGSLRDEIASQALTYGYLTLATLVVLVSLGRVIGKKEDTLRSIAVTDPLTGLWNRRYLRDRIEEEMRRVARYGGKLSLLLIDLDGLKVINDRRGHSAGDAALRCVAGCLKRTCRSTDIAARFGGDEFIVLAPETDAVSAAELAERIMAAVRQNGAPEPLSVSIGIAGLEQVGQADPEALLEAADRALYEAKATGRNRAVLAPLAAR